MSMRGLQILLVTALTDPPRQAALLRRCSSAYEGFDLSEPEVRDLLAIEAASLEEFARQAHQLFYGTDLGLESDPAPRRNAATERECA